MMIMRITCWLLASLCLGMTLGGCITTRADMVREIKKYTLPIDVMPGKGLIYVLDTLPFKLRLTGTVFLDGEDDAAKVGSLSPGKYIYIHVLPGYHRIKIPHWSPYEFVVEVEEGDILFLGAITDQKQKTSIIIVDGVVGRYFLKRLE